MYNKYLASSEHQALIYPDEDDRARGKAAIIALVRNRELREMSQSMRELEETFNRKFRYPWIFFNDEPFEDKFKRITTSLTDAETFYGTKHFPSFWWWADLGGWTEVIPKEHWDVPKWIHPDLMDAAFDKLDSQGVQYAKMLSYHKMCRWNSGLFFHHPALANYTWYWRVEPNVQYIPLPSTYLY
jgi:mannosyltransferase